MGCKYVKDFDFGPEKTYVKGYARGGEAKPAKSKVNMNKGGSCYAKGGYAKGGKPVVEKETGERYPSRKAMVKHEAEETPRMQREEVVKRAEIKAPVRKMVPVAARTPMVMKKGGNVKTQFPDGGPVQGAQMQGAPVQGGLNQMRQGMGQPMAAQQFNPQMMQQGMQMRQMGQQFNQQMMNPMMGGMGGYGMGQMGRMPPQMGGMGGYPMGVMGGYGMMRGPMGMMGGYPRGMMGGYNPMMGGYNPMMGGMGGYGMGRMMGGMGGYGGGYGYNQPMYPPMGGMQGYGARGQFGQPQQYDPQSSPISQQQGLAQPEEQRRQAGAVSPEIAFANSLSPQEKLRLGIMPEAPIGSGPEFREQQNQILRNAMSNPEILQGIRQSIGSERSNLASQPQGMDYYRNIASNPQSAFQGQIGAIGQAQQQGLGQMAQAAQEAQRQASLGNPAFTRPMATPQISAAEMQRLAPFINIRPVQQQGVPSYNAQPMIAQPRMMMAKGGKVSSAKVGKVMGEFKSGQLHSGSPKGPLVKNRQQAMAIAMSEGRKAAKR